ncbi:hypothetical protein LSAT2_004365 [Lamellibrachia satsuma]|nr:hypothetical protein LSAT2_004365 [Lamellibrachia satsuma]
MVVIIFRPQVRRLSHPGCWSGGFSRRVAALDSPEDTESQRQHLRLGGRGGSGPLQGCHIPAAGLGALAVELQHLTALKTLNLSVNTFDSAAAAALGRSLSLLRQLKTLGLWGCHMDDEMAVDIAEGAANSPRLQYLGLDLNHISRRGRRRVRAICRGRVEACTPGATQEPPSEDCGCELFHQQHNDWEDNSDNHRTCCISCCRCQ